MKAGLRIGIAAIAAALAHVPAPAQTSAPANEADAGAVGPRELRDFQLNGTVTRPATPAPAPAAPAPANPQPRNETAPATPAPRQQPAPAAEPPAAARDQTRPSGSVTVALPPAPAPATRPAEQAGTAERTFSSQPNFARPVEPEAAAIPPDQQGQLLPWLLAALLLAGGIGYLAWRQHSRPALAGAGRSLEPFTPPPGPAAEPLKRSTSGQPAMAPDLRDPVLAGGVIGTRLRPDLQIEFEPGRCVWDEQKATIEFDISVLNSGHGPARDLLLQACMFNAGPEQDDEMGAWVAHPVERGQRVPLLEPLKRLSLKSAVTLTREQMKIFDAGGRRFFVPLIAFNAIYRWSGGQAQTATSFLVGRDTKAEKLAPFRLDMGPRVFRGLGAREYRLRAAQ